MLFLTVLTYSGERKNFTLDDKYISNLFTFLCTNQQFFDEELDDRNLMALPGLSRATELRLAVSEHLPQMQVFNRHFYFLSRFWLICLFSLPGNVLNAQMHGTNLQLAVNSIY